MNENCFLEKINLPPRNQWVFYKDLFELEVFQDYGRNISFGGLSLQQDFDWLLGIPKKSS